MANSIKEIVDYIQENVKLEKIASMYTELKEKRNSLWGLSPFKEEKTPSFSISKEKNVYYCFATAQGGNVITFIMKVENLQFKEAIEFILEKENIQLEYSNLSMSKKHDYKKNKEIKELYQRIAKSFNDILMNKKNGQNALNYLLKRGFNKEVIKDFCVGYCPGGNWLYSFLKEQEYSDAFLKESNFFLENNSRISYFSSRVVFPIFDRFNDVIAFGGRKLENINNSPKYINSAESEIYKKKDNLYGFYQSRKQIREENNVYIVEGYLDVLALYQAGYKNVVSSLGTSLTNEQIDFLLKNTDNFTLIFDGDKAGQNACERAITMLLTKGIESKIIILENGIDPADLLLIKDGFSNLESVEWYKLILNSLQKKYGENEASKEKIKEEFFKLILKATDSKTRTNALLEHLSRFLLYYNENILYDFENFKKKNKEIDTNEVDCKSEDKEVCDYQKMFLTLCVNNLDFFENANEMFFLEGMSYNTFVSKKLSKAYDLILSSFLQGFKNNKLLNLLNRFSFLKNNKSEEFELIAKDKFLFFSYIYKIKNFFLSREILKISREISKYDYYLEYEDKNILGLENFAKAFHNEIKRNNNIQKKIKIGHYDKEIL